MDVNIINITFKLHNGIQMKRPSTLIKYTVYFKTKQITQLNANTEAF